MMSQQTTASTLKTKTARRKVTRQAALAVVAALGLAVLAFTLLGGQIQRPSPDRSNTITVKKGRAQITVLATGLIRPTHEVKISPKQTGLLMSLFVKQGDYVKAGQLIALMDDSNLVGQVEAARGTYLAALDNYDKMKSGNRPQEVAAARFQMLRAEKAVGQTIKTKSRLDAQVEALTAQVTRDETFAERQAFLADSGAVSDQAKIDAQTQARVANAQLNAAKRDREQAEIAIAQSQEELNTSRQQANLSKAGFRKEEIAAALHNAMQAKGQLTHIQSLLNDTRIKAPFDGVITQKYTDAGAIVTPTTSAATTSATSSSIVSLAGKLEMVAQVSESSIPKVVLGQKVEITATAHPGRTFHGRVTQIAPAAIVTQNVTTFEVHAEIEDDPKHELLAGMNVGAKFVVGRLNDALTVPTVCVISRRGRTGVLVPDESGQPRFKPVRTGPTVGQDIVILEGLKAGDRVYQGLSREQLGREGYAGRADRDRGGGLPFPGGGRGMRGFGGGRGG